MTRSLLLLLVLPLGSVAAQASGLRITFTAPNQAAFRITGVPVPSMLSDCANCTVRVGADSAPPVIAQGRVEFTTDPAAAGIRNFGGIEVAALDTTTAIHVEARQDGRLVASADGVYLNVRRDTTGIAIEARSRVPSAIARTLRRPE